MIAYYYSPSDRWSTARRYLTITGQHRQMCVLFLPSHSLSLTVSSSSGMLCCLHLLVYSNRLVDLIIIHYHWVESIAPCICLWNIRCTEEAHDPSMELSFIIFARIQFEFPSILVAPQLLFWSYLVQVAR